MKRRDLVRLLVADGWILIAGGNHDLAKHPDRLGKIPIPRHREINEYTARNILQAAGIDDLK
jgi:predicted RNA binding protein YcfA (HicA-like mRNA interferase family)